MPNKHEDSILRSLRRISRAIDVYSRRLAKGYELTGPQLVCLRHLESHEDCTPKDLANAVSLSAGTVSGILDRLERRELVLRERSTRDKRRVFVRLTAKGRSLVAYAPSPMHEHFAKRLDALPEAEQQEIDEILARVVRMMEAGDYDAAPVMASGPILAEHEDVEEFLTEESKKP